MTREHPGTHKQPGLKTLTMKPVAIGGACGIPLGAVLITLPHSESVVSLLPVLAALPVVLLWSVAASLRWIVLTRPHWLILKLIPADRNFGKDVAIFSFGIGLFLGIQVAASLFAP